MAWLPWLQGKCKFMNVWLSLNLKMLPTQTVTQTIRVTATLNLWDDYKRREVSSCDSGDSCS